MKKKITQMKEGLCIFLLLPIMLFFHPEVTFGAAPTLSWTEGAEGLWNDGVHPDYGIVSSDTFTFQVTYKDGDNNPPQAGYPKVYIKRGGVDIPGSPFTLTQVDPLDTNYQDGKQYKLSGTPSVAGNDWRYAFVAVDSTDENASGIPTFEHTFTVVTGYVWVDKVLGDDVTGTGTEANPYEKITKGVNSASSGQAVRVRVGTIASPYVYYQEGTWIVTAKGGYWDEKITMVNGVHVVTDNSNGGDVKAVYDDPYSSYQTSMLTRTGRILTKLNFVFPSTITEDVLVDGFTSDRIAGKQIIDINGQSPIIRNNIFRRGSGRSGGFALTILGASDITTAPIIENNIIHSVNQGIGISKYAYPIIQDNEIYDTDSRCIGINQKGTPGGDITIRNNRIFNSNAACIGSTGLVKDLKLTIQGNDIHDCGLNTAIYSGAGIGLERCCTPFSTLEIIIGGSTPAEGNQIYNCRMAGIRLDGKGLALNPVLIQNNEIYNNGKAGILLVDVGHPTLGAATIMDNNIHGHVNGAGINIGGHSHGTISSNLIYDNKAGIAFNMGAVEFDPPPPLPDDPHYDPSPFHDNTINIEENDIYQNSFAGIMVKDSITGTVNIARNEIYENDRAGIGIINSCNLDIINNNIHNNIRGGIHTGTDVEDDFFNDDGMDTEGFIGPSDSAQLSITQNKVHHNGLNSYGGGIDVRHGSGPINNNLVYSNMRGGIRFGDFTTEIINNTVIGNGDEDNRMGGGIVYDDLAGAVNDRASGKKLIGNSGIPIRNNISMLNARAGIRDDFCRGNQAANPARDYNLVYMNNSCKYWNPTHAPANLGACWKNPHEIVADPQLVDIDTDDYRIQSTSPAADAGDSAYGTDISLPPGVLTALIDMGAFGGPLGIDW